MQYKRLTGPQRKILAWRGKRDRFVQKLLDQDKFLTREQALLQANRLAGPMPRGN